MEARALIRRQQRRPPQGCSIEVARLDDLARHRHGRLSLEQRQFLPSADAGRRVAQAGPSYADGRARVVGDIGITGVGAAVANAVFNATGARVSDLPITLDKVLRARLWVAIKQPPKEHSW
jgi:hypothetical protein